MKSNPWFRVYNEIVDDEKLRLLAFEDRWHFMAILACKNAGIIDEGGPLLEKKLCIKLGIDNVSIKEVARRLSEVGLIDKDTFQPIKWDDRQFKSDNSTERVRAFRERTKRVDKDEQKQVKRFRNADVTAQETETETEEHTLSIKALSIKRASKQPDVGDGFDAFWDAYPRKVNKTPARKAWLKIAPDDSLQARILAAVAVAKADTRWREEGGRFIPHASTWLNAERWTDEIGPPKDIVPVVDSRIQFRDSVDAYGRKLVAI